MSGFNEVLAGVLAMFMNGQAPDVNYERPYSPHVYNWDSCKAPHWSCNQDVTVPEVDDEDKE